MLKFTTPKTLVHDSNSLIIPTSHKDNKYVDIDCSLIRVIRDVEGQLVNIELIDHHRKRKYCK